MEPKRFLKFCIVGLSGVGVNIGLLWLLTEFFGLFYLVSAVFSVEASIISNFILNELWTFRDRVTRRSARALLKRMVKFNLTCAVGAAINILVLAALTELLGLYYIVSALFGIGAATLWNYGMSITWTWSRVRSQRTR
jgi:dolichol-phosphate mannosyltransferase